MKTVIKELKACRFKNFEIDKVVFLLNLRNFILGEGDLVKLKRKQELINLNFKNVTPFLKICKLDRVTAKAFFNFKLSVTGISVMNDFNLTGKDISDKILELEVENFKITKQKAITKFMTKKRNVLDAQIDLKSLLKHITVNFTHGFLSGLAIAFVSSNIYLLIAISYYIFKRFDSLILNRDKYTTKLGQDYIFPIPSTIGFTLGCFISSIIGPLLKK